MLRSLSSNDSSQMITNSSKSFGYGNPFSNFQSYFLMNYKYRF